MFDHLRFVSLALAGWCALLVIPFEAQAQVPGVLTPRAYASAVYPLKTSVGEPGHVQVSAAVVRNAKALTGRTVVHLRYQVANDTSDELELDEHGFRLDWWVPGRGVDHEAGATRVVGETKLEAGERGTVNVYFAIGGGLEPDPEDVFSFRVRWSFESRAGDDREVVQYTVFARDPNSGRYFFTPYFDPFLNLPPVSGMQLDVRSGAFRLGQSRSSVHTSGPFLPSRPDGRTDTMR